MIHLNNSCSTHKDKFYQVIISPNTLVTIRRYYNAGAARVAMRVDLTLYYLLG